MSEKHTAARPIWRRLWPWALLVLILIWWGLLWSQLDRSVLTRVPILDEAFYLEEGAAIAGGRLLPEQSFIMSPLYPYLVAVTGSGRQVYATGVRMGAPPVGLRLLQLACWCGILWLLWQAGRRLLPAWAAILPPVMFALYRPATTFTTLPLLEIPLTFTVTAYLYLIAFSDRARKKWWGAVVAGLLLGAATLLRASSLLLWLPGLLAWHGSSHWRRQMALLTATALALLAPVSVFNSVESGRPAGVSCNGGLNLFIGNGPEANGFYVVFAGFDFQEDPAGVGFLSARLDRPVAGVGEADQIWAGAAWRTMMEDPGRAARLWLKKVWLHFVNWEISQVTPLEAWQRHVPRLRLLLLPYGAIAAAGLTGLLLSGWRDRRLRTWMVALLLLVAGQSLFFVVSRYRLVLVPMLCLMGVVGLVNLGRSRGWRLAVACVALVLTVLFVQPWGLGSVRAQWDAIGYCNEAARWQRLDDEAAPARAETLYLAALEIDPTQMIAYRGLARVLVGEDRKDEAEDVLTLGILRVPRSEFLERDLINHLLEQGKVAAAIPYLAAYLGEHLEDADMLHNYAVALARTGRLEAAERAARDLITRMPDDPRGYIDLGILLVRAGKRAEARKIFAAGLVRHPDHEGLRHNLELLGR